MKKKIPKAVSEYFSRLGKKSRGGGRPRKPDDELTEKQKQKRAANERYRAGKKKAET